MESRMHFSRSDSPVLPDAVHVSTYLQFHGFSLFATVLPDTVMLWHASFTSHLNVAPTP